MTTQYINQYINQNGQLDIYSLLIYIKDLCKHKFYYKADALVNELYEIYSGTIYDNVNNNLFTMSYSEEVEMYLLLDRISNKLYGEKVYK